MFPLLSGPTPIVALLVALLVLASAARSDRALSLAEALALTRAHHSELAQAELDV